MPNKYSVVVNTATGRCCAPLGFRSLQSAIDYAFSSGGFAWRILDGKSNELLRRGFCK